jgi:hypothetical protein
VNRTSLLLTAGGLFIVVAVGCQAIAGLESRTADPQAVGCSLPSSGDARIRLANMANVAGSTDFCIKPSSSSDWGRPVFRDGGNDNLCLGNTGVSGGLRYTNVTIPFAEPVGKIDVRAIPAGQTCTFKPTSETDGIVVGNKATSPVVTIVRWGGGSSKEAIVALPERTNVAADGNSHVRVVNALSDNKSITFGISDSQSLPGLVDRVVVTTPITPGTVPVTQGSGTELFGVDSAGYLSTLTVSIGLAAAYATDPTNKAITIFRTPNNTDTATFYVIGDPGDTTNSGHVVRGLYCEDNALDTQAQLPVVDAGPVDAAAGGYSTHDLTLLSECTLAQLPVLSIDMLNTSLYGANSPFQALRAGYMPAAVAARLSDLMCVVEVDDLQNRLNIITEAAGSTTPVDLTTTGSASNPGWFPYYYAVTSDQTTPPTNKADAKPLPANAPCSPSAVSPTLSEGMFQCVDAKCSSVTGGDDAGIGILAGTTSCLTGPCVSPLGRMYTSPAPDDRTSAGYLDDVCLDCAIYYFTSELPLGQAQTNCTSNNTQLPFAFSGQTPAFILSHHPLKNTAVYNLPATGYRRAVLKAQVTLEDESVVDFFCAQLTSPLIDSSLPYTGNYGSDGDEPDNNGWQEEQDLQSKEAIAWIQSETAKDGVPAIIASDLHSDDGVAPLTGLSTEVVDAFKTTFTPAEVAAEVQGTTAPVCDYCSATLDPTTNPNPNPYNADTSPYELMHAYVQGFPTNATQSETLWGNDSTFVVISQGVPGEVTPPGGTGPLLEYYAHNYQILRPTH